MTNGAERPLTVQVHGAPTLLRLGLEHAVNSAGLALATTPVQADVQIVARKRATPSVPAVALRLDADLVTLTITAKQLSSLRPELITLLAAALDLAV
jgi:hypothetical protein